MKSDKQIALLKRGKSAWNAWRKSNPAEIPHFEEADLRGLDLTGCDLSNALLNGADLTGATITESIFNGASLASASLRNARGENCSFMHAVLWDIDASDATLVGSNMSRAELVGAQCTGADFRRVELWSANLFETNFTRADLREASLENSLLIRTVFDEADLTGCHVYGIAAWDVTANRTIQNGLRISQTDDPDIRVDNLEVAQFLYLWLNNQNLKTVIDTITSKVVLILGRFSGERKPILDAIRDELPKRDYLPVLFDFEKPSNRDITETVSTLAHMARFVIADLSDPKSIPHELAHVIPLLPSVPFVPLIVSPQEEYTMFEHFFGFRHVLKPFRYRNEDHLLRSLGDKVIGPAERLARRVAGRRTRK